MKLMEIKDRSDVVVNMVSLCSSHNEDLFQDDIAHELRELAILGYDLREMGKPLKLKDGRE